MNMPVKELHVVDMADTKVPEGQKRTYYKNTHPELASLSELAADFPAEERPLISDFGDTHSVMDTTPLAKGDIDNAVLGEIKPIKHSFLYKILLGMSLLFMSGVVALYLGLVGAVGYLIYSKGYGYIQNFSGSSILDVMSNGLFAVFGTLLLIGMIKAVLMRTKKKAVYEISKEEEPVFFYYLETLCDKLNTALPKRVYVSCEVECAYSSLFSNKYDLYVGLPLVEGFGTKELSGILAHELCRFRKDGSFLVEKVRKFYLWLGRVTCHQDQLDKYIYTVNQKMIGKPWRIPFILTELFFKVPRKMLHCFMWVTHLFCQFAIHKIDYESDYYEVQFAGNKKFEEIAYSMEVMSQTLSNTQNGFDTSKLNQS